MKWSRDDQRPVGHFNGGLMIIVGPQNHFEIIKGIPHVVLDFHFFLKINFWVRMCRHVVTPIIGFYKSIVSLSLEDNGFAFLLRLGLLVGHLYITNELYKYIYILVVNYTNNLYIDIAWSELFKMYNLHINNELYKQKYSYQRNYLSYLYINNELYN